MYDLSQKLVFEYKIVLFYKGHFILMQLSVLLLLKDGQILFPLLPAATLARRKQNATPNKWGLSRTAVKQSLSVVSC